MTRFNKMWFLLAIPMICTQAGAEYEISSYTIDGGGDTSENNDYSLSATIGQPDAGIMTGGEYTLSGGFWSSLAIPCLVDMTDLLNFVDDWVAREGTFPGDLNVDGDVNLIDFSILTSFWLTTCPNGWPL